MNGWLVKSHGDSMIVDPEQNCCEVVLLAECLLTSTRRISIATEYWDKNNTTHARGSHIFAIERLEVKKPSSGRTIRLDFRGLALNKLVKLLPSSHNKYIER